MKLIENGFFKRNKKVLLIALVIFLISAIAGAVGSYVTIGDQYGLITESFNNLSANGTSTNGPVGVGMTDVELISHNMVADLIVIFCGLLFSIPSVILVVFNGISIASLFGVDFTFAAISILPHGIIEYLASVIALAVAFNITKIEWAMIKNRSFRNTLKENKTELKDILVMIIVVLILLIIAGFIEANITPGFIASFYGV